MKEILALRAEKFKKFIQKGYEAGKISLRTGWNKSRPVRKHVYNVIKIVWEHIKAAAKVSWKHIKAAAKVSWKHIKAAAKVAWKHIKAVSRVSWKHIKDFLRNEKYIKKVNLLYAAIFFILSYLIIFINSAFQGKMKTLDTVIFHYESSGRAVFVLMAGVIIFNAVSAINLIIASSDYYLNSNGKKKYIMAGACLFVSVAVTVFFFKKYGLISIVKDDMITTMPVIILSSMYAAMWFVCILGFLNIILKEQISLLLKRIKRH